MEKFNLKDIEKRLGTLLLQKRLSRQQKHSTFQFRGGFKVFWEKSNVLASSLELLLKAVGQYRSSLNHTLDYQLIERNIHLQNLPQEFNGYRILHLSDIHIDGVLDHAEKLSNILQNLEFDICFITGDFRYLTYGQFHESLLYTKRLVEILKPKAPILGILGNHDAIEMVAPLEDMGIKMLLNESTVITKNNSSIGIAGVDDPHFYETHDIKKSVQDIQHCPLKILLAHSPEVIQEASEANFDLYLCGHTHGGQVCLPGMKPIIQNISSQYHGPYISGSWTYNKMIGYTSRGTGSSGLPVRVFCPPEITIHTLKTTDECEHK